MDFAAALDLVEHVSQPFLLIYTVFVDFTNGKDSTDILRMWSSADNLRV